MDFAYFHIVTNHLPIFGVPLALFLLLLGVWRRSDELKAASFLIFALLGIATLGVYLLGRGGEDFIEDLAGVSEEAIENHQDVAKIALAAVGSLAALSFYALLRFSTLNIIPRGFSQNNSTDDVEKKRTWFFPPWIVFSILAVALASSAILGYTGKLGGMIRHTEFYGGDITADKEDSGKGRGRRRNRGKD